MINIAAPNCPFAPVYLPAYVPLPSRKPIEALAAMAVKLGLIGPKTVRSTTNTTAAVQHPAAVPSYTPYLGRSFEEATNASTTAGFSGYNNTTSTVSTTTVPTYQPTASLARTFEEATYAPTTTGSSGYSNTPSSFPVAAHLSHRLPTASMARTFEEATNAPPTAFDWSTPAMMRNTLAASSRTTRTTAVCKETPIKKDTPSSDPWEDYFNKRRNSKRTTNPADLEKERKRKNEKEIPSLLRGMEGGSQRASSMHRLMKIGTADLFEKFKVKEAAEKVAKEWGEDKWYVREVANKLLDAIWKAEGRQGVREQEEPARTTRKRRRAVEEPQRPTPAKRRPKMEIITID